MRTDPARGARPARLDVRRQLCTPGSRRDLGRAFVVSCQSQRAWWPQALEERGPVRRRVWRSLGVSMFAIPGPARSAKLRNQYLRYIVNPIASTRRRLTGQIGPLYRGKCGCRCRVTAEALRSGLAERTLWAARNPPASRPVRDLATTRARRSPSASGDSARYDARSRRKPDVLQLSMMCARAAPTPAPRCLPCSRRSARPAFGAQRRSTRTCSTCSGRRPRPCSARQPGRVQRMSAPASGRPRPPDLPADAAAHCATPANACDEALPGRRRNARIAHLPGRAQEGHRPRHAHRWAATGRPITRARRRR